MKLIFLDIDGVLNSQTAFLNGECKYVDVLGRPDWHHQSFSKSSKELINVLIQETGANVVISSTWRRSGQDFMEAVWKNEGMLGKIVGITPSLHCHPDQRFTVPRGCEIGEFLEKKIGFHHINWSRKEQQDRVDFSGLESYVIIDDDSDMLLTQKNHFVHVEPSPRNNDGFHAGHLEKALRILNSSIVPLNFDNQVTTSKLNIAELDARVDKVLNELTVESIEEWQKMDKERMQIDKEDEVQE